MLRVYVHHHFSKGQKTEKLWKSNMVAHKAQIWSQMWHGLAENQPMHYSYFSSSSAQSISENTDWGHHVSELFVSIFGNSDRKWKHLWEVDIIFFMFYFFSWFNLVISNENPAYKICGTCLVTVVLCSLWINFQSDQWSLM